MRGNATVVRVRPTPGGVDQYGDPVTGADVRTTIPGCAVAPRSTIQSRSSNDIVDRGRSGVSIGLTVYVPFGTDIAHTDLLDIDGVRYEIDGDGGAWKSPYTGWEAGIEVAVRRAEG